MLLLAVAFLIAHLLGVELLTVAMVVQFQSLSRIRLINTTTHAKFSALGFNLDCPDTDELLCGMKGKGSEVRGEEFFFLRQHELRRGVSRTEQRAEAAP